MVVGMTVMRNANVVVRDLSALEALGGVTNICSDKTGTLTQGAMIVKKVWLPRIGIYTVNNSTNPNDPTQGDVTMGPESTKTSVPSGRIDYDSQRSAAALKFDVPLEKVTKDQLKVKHTAEELAGITPELEEFLRPTALCNLATVKQETIDEKNSKWQTTGEPTEIALQVFANRFDYGKRRLKFEGWNQVAEFPFDSSIKRMSVVYKSPRTRESFVFTKGAVERVLDLCSTIGTNSIYEPITEDLKEQVLNQMDEFANQGQRVLAIASKKWDGDFPEQHGSNVDDMRANVESGLILLGLVGIYDPPRDETKGAIRECSEAGIKVHMLTVSQHSTDVGLALT
jgi:P-type Na+/K+ transporter